jgi:hypothetical protein
MDPKDLLHRGKIRRGKFEIEVEIQGRFPVMDEDRDRSYAR